MEDSARNKFIWIGVAAGTAAGVMYALSRRSHPRDHWGTARQIADRLSNRSGDLAGRSKELISRVQRIYEESRKAMDDAVDLWGHGRKLVGV
jgi:hypothetical protein